MITTRGFGGPAITTAGWGTWGVTVAWPPQAWADLVVAGDAATAVVVAGGGVRSLVVGVDAVRRLVEDGIVTVTISVGPDAMRALVVIKDATKGLEVAGQAAAQLSLLPDGRASIVVAQDAMLLLDEDAEQADHDLSVGADASRALVLDEEGAMSTKYDITAEALQQAGYRPIHAGDSYDHAFTATIAGSTDLRGSKMWLTVKENSIQSDASAKLQLYGEDPLPEPPPDPVEIEYTDAEDGEFTVHFLPDATEDLEGTWMYDLQVLLASGKVVTLAYGKIQFLQNLTRSTAPPTP